MAAVSYSGFRWNQSHKFYNPNVGKGAVLFTGPDGIGDYKTRILNPKVIGIGTLSREGTSDLGYILRAARNCPHPRPKSAKVGEVGWNVSSLREDYASLWNSGHQIKLHEFRLACELRHTHLYQNPWYPAPARKTKEQSTILDLRKYNRCQTQPNPGYRKTTKTNAHSNLLKHKQQPISLAFRV